MSLKGIKYYSVILVVFFTIECRAQQQPMYTQYMFNGLVLNPAYAGVQETFSATAVVRKQWVGMEGAPETQTFSAHSPLDDLRTRKRPGSPVSLGLTVFHDQLAITTQTGFLAAYAYKITTGSLSSLSFGLQGGFSQYRVRYSELELDDPSFSSGDVVEWQPEFGAGIYYRDKRFYAGASLPQMLRSRRQGDNSSLSLAPHLFLTAGYVFDLNESVRIKPNILLKTTRSVYQVDINCNFFFNEILNLGVSWRSSESVSTLAQLQIHPRFAVGYAYDIGIGSDLSMMSTGSHEFMLGYRVPKKKIRTINPRYF